MRNPKNRPSALTCIDESEGCSLPPPPSPPPDPEPRPEEPPKTAKEVMETFVEKVEKAARDSNPIYAWEFLKIRAESEDMKTVAEFSTSAGEEPENAPKNRYRDILPFDYGRIRLSDDLPFPIATDYINASYISGPSKRVAYIAAQAPLPESLIDFWKMLLETNVHMVVMLCKLEEAGRKKCEQYWPDSPAEPLVICPGVSVELAMPEETIAADCVERFLRLRVVYEDEHKRPIERIIRQLHYTEWPDHGTPSTIQPVLQLLASMREAQPYERAPVLVHCSAGCGRTGTIIALDYVRSLLHSGALSRELDLCGIVTHLRKQRVAMVQTLEQYALLHEAVAEMFRQQLLVMEQHDYQNLPLAIPAPLQADEDETIVVVL